MFRKHTVEKKAAEKKYCSVSLEKINRKKESPVSKNDITKAESISPHSSAEDGGLEYQENYRFPNGAIYTGTFLLSTHTNVAIGQWKNGMRHGYGVQIWPDGAKYEGHWQNDQAHGKGKFWHADGDTFDGEWRADKAHGFGIYMHKNGAKYKGEWKEDLQDGYGVEAWVDGSKYEGDYLHGKKNGKGTYYWIDGSRYSGDWNNNKIDGEVLIIFETTFHLGKIHVVRRTSLRRHVEEQQHARQRRLYMGRWTSLRRHLSIVHLFIGEYFQDKKHGKGKYRWADGRVYDGMWLNGKQNGEGKYIASDGTTRIGIWKNGKRTQWNDDGPSPKEVADVNDDCDST